MECDFSSISKYGYHTLRVRAEFEDERSDWVNITFCPVDDSKPLCFPFHCNVIILHGWFPIGWPIDKKSLSAHKGGGPAQEA